MNYNPGDIIGGKYQILDLIGGGAMGAVYKAENLNMKKQVAIKVLHGDFAEQQEYQTRFMREARSAAALEHSNICTIMDFDTTADGDSYIVMELLAGETLKQRIARLGSLTPNAAVRIMRQLIGALSCAHKNGIVHRDIKPDNIFLIEREGADDFVKLIDFGIAHIESPEGDLKTLTQVGQIYGTPQYISPEQAEGDPVDHRADLYAAGVIFYEMLTGQPVFVGKNYIELLLKQVNEPAPHLPDDIMYSNKMDVIIQKMLAKKPDDRYNSALEIIPLLDEILIKMSNDNPSSLANLGSHSLVMSLQSLKSEMNSGDNSTPENIIDALPRSKRQWQIMLLCALIFALILIIIFHFISSAVHTVTENDNNVAEIIKQDEGQDIQNKDAAGKAGEVAEQDQVVGDPQPFDTSSEEYKISSDTVLSHDSIVSSTVEDYYNKRYSQALASLDSVKSKYWNHPNFVRIYILTCRHLRKHNEAMDALAQLISIEPNAVKNPGIAKFAYEYFNSKENSPILRDQIVAHGGNISATVIAWLIIGSEYDQNEIRLNRLFEVYDKLDHESVPQWLKQAVEIWKLNKSNCKTRKTLLIRLASTDLNEVYQYILDPMSKQRSKECKQGRMRVDCNACLQNWLSEAITAHNNRIHKDELEKANDEPEKEDAEGENPEGENQENQPETGDNAAD